MSILIVEDEPKLAAVLSEYLVNAQFRTHWISNGLEVVSWVRANDPELILLDLMLPGRDGIDVCKEIRSFSEVPIIMTTARVEEIDRLLGLELGADDYVCKPYSPREVIARIRAIFRRMDAQSTAPTGGPDLRIDEDRMEASLGGRSLNLTPVEIRLLSALLKRPGRVLSRNQLLDCIYEDHRIVTDRTVDSHIKNLRKKIASHLPGQEVISSVYGVGYKLEL